MTWLLNIFALSFFFLIFWYNLLHGIAPTESLDRWLVEVSSDEIQCIEEWWLENGFAEKKYILKKLPVKNWFLVEVPKSYSNSIANLSCINSFVPDLKLLPRTTIPNDIEYSKQNDMSLIGMPSAWDISTGGISYRGDTIVVAIIDDGFQFNHEDLIQNLWHNWNEIPEDNLDNDGNGYVDDFLGLNISTGNDNHRNLSHGTSVSGIVGAKGNNEIGISGINWNIKLMFVSYDHHVSELIQAYQYVIDMRRKYNETGGKEGAFVVAANLSAGIDFAKPEDFPLWCSIYDSLGAVGVLGVCSTTNYNYSVEVLGCLPSRCQSPYTIITTNVDTLDQKVENAGFGRKSVDIGAPGEGSLTTDLNNSYSFFRGTSAAAPHVTGTVALLYSSSCTSFFDSLDVNPGLVASQVKNLIMSAGSSNISLQGITVSGKRLNTSKALELLESYCIEQSQPKPLIRFLAPNPTDQGFFRMYFEFYDIRSELSLDIYSVNGSIIESRDLDQSEYQNGFITVDTESFSSGVYFICLRSSEFIETYKFIVIE